MAEQSDPGRGGPGSGTVERAARLLGAVADAGTAGTGVGALAAALELPASTVHRLLKLLIDEDLVYLDADRHVYTVGAELYRISALVIDAVDPAVIVQPIIQGLADRFDETVLYGVYFPQRAQLGFASRADGQQLLQYRIELNAPKSIVWGASGKSVLSQLPDDQVARILSELGDTVAPGDASRPPSLADLVAELDVIRERGYAVSEGETLPLARGIGVPVHGPGGVVGSLTLTSPRDRLPHGEIDAIGRTMVAEAQELSRRLGAHWS